MGTSTSRPLRGREKLFLYALLAPIVEQKNVTFGGRSIWPLLRIFLFHLLKNPNYRFSGRGLDRLASFAETFIQPPRPISLSSPELDSGVTVTLNHMGAFDYRGGPILFMRDQVGQVQIGSTGMYIDKFLDPIIQDLPNDVGYVKFDVTGKLSRNLLIASHQDSNIKLIRTAPKLEIAGDLASLNVINSHLERFGGQRYFSAESFQNSLLNRVEQYSFFHSLLSQLQPKFVFVRCFYSPIWLSLRLAAESLKIAVVDLQHGITGPYHSAYTHWTGLREGVCNILPTWFWAWDERSACNLSQLDGSPLPNVRIRNSGNPWRTFQKTIDWGAHVSDVLKKFKSFKRIILVALGYSLSRFPPFVIPALALLEKNHSDHLVLIRRHPAEDDNYSAEFMAELSPLLSARTNIDFENASALPLELVLDIADTVLCDYSTVAVEAHHYGCQVVLTNKAAIIDLFDQGPPSDASISFVSSTKEVAEILVSKPGVISC